MAILCQAAPAMLFVKVCFKSADRTSLDICSSKMKIKTSLKISLTSTKKSSLPLQELKVLNQKKERKKERRGQFICLLQPNLPNCSLFLSFLIIKKGCDLNDQYFN